MYAVNKHGIIFSVYARAELIFAYYPNKKTLTLDDELVGYINNNFNFDDNFKEFFVNELITIYK